MDSNPDREVNYEAYKRLKPLIDQSYPPKQYVAIDGGEIIGASADFWQLYEAIKGTGKDPRDVLVVQTGEDYTEYAHFLGIAIRLL